MLRGKAAVSLVLVDSDNLGEVSAVFDELRTFSLRVDGVLRRCNAAYAFATTVPPG